MSDDISAAPEVRAALESNRHQQIVLFVYISINGHVSLSPAALLLTVVARATGHDNKDVENAEKNRSTKSTSFLLGFILRCRYN
ncbi:hypothetical protein FQN60_006132 [Etheostoma spectabile]|uniref:Uncharacterized protein n=1 Tax=Etheostoma spectabile TaxID=54343 RepID=A0A5J5CS85_9PERO|nr:hypothetical protein FQN60_006132 [Etheostoma spectabile]